MANELVDWSSIDDTWAWNSSSFKVLIDPLRDRQVLHRTWDSICERLYENGHHARCTFYNMLGHRNHPDGEKPGDVNDDVYGVHRKKNQAETKMKYLRAITVACILVRPTSAYDSPVQISEHIDYYDPCTLRRIGDRLTV